MKNYLKLIKYNNNTYDVHNEDNNVFIGDLYQDQPWNEYLFYPNFGDKTEVSYGGYPSYILRQIADELDKLNQPLYDHLNNADLSPGC